MRAKLAVLVAALCVAGSQPADAPLSKDLAALQGAWKLVGFQADEREGRQDATLKVRLDVDATRVEPDQSMRNRSCQHIVNVDNNVSRVCDAKVPKVCRISGRRARLRRTRPGAGRSGDSHACDTARRAAILPARGSPGRGRDGR